MSPKNFQGHLLEFPGGVYPKNSVFEAMERRRAEGEEAIRVSERRKLGECKGLKLAKVIKDKNTKLYRCAVCAEYMLWIEKNPKVHPNLAPRLFYDELREHMPKRLRLYRKRLKPKGRLITFRQFKTILAPVLKAK